MKKLGILLVALVMLIGTGYIFGRNLKSGGLGQLSQMGSLKNSTTDTTSEDTIRTSIKNLMSKNKPVKCTIKVEDKDKDGEGKWTGVTYVANNKMRSDVSMETEDEESEDKKIEMHTISDGDWVYTWTSNAKMPGMKMKISELENLSADQGNLAEGLKNLEEEHDYHCSRWFPVDKSKFIPPSGIEFKDMTEMMKGFGDAMQNIEMDEIEKDAENAKQQLCKMCEMVPDEKTRAKCRKDAGCDE